MQGPQSPPQATATTASLPHTTPTDFCNAIQQHACFKMWEAAAQIMFKTALDSDADGAQRFKEMQQAPPTDAFLATSAFHKTKAGKLYRAIGFEHKIQFM